MRNNAVRYHQLINQTTLKKSVSLYIKRQEHMHITINILYYYKLLHLKIIIFEFRPFIFVIIYFMLANQIHHVAYGSIIMIAPVPSTAV